MVDKLEKLCDGKSNWFEKSQFREDNKVWIKFSQTIALKILRIIREQNINKYELSDKLGIPIHEVNDYLKGNKKFTIETISKLETVLGIKL